MLLTAIELHHEQPPDAWFCLKTQTRREHLAAVGLRTSGVDVFCPQIRLRRATTRGAVWFQEAMFPSYLFARFDFALEGRRISYSPGVRGLVHFGERFALIADAILQPLIAICGQEETAVIEAPIKTGDLVTILDGPMRGLEGVVTRIPRSQDRVAVLLNFLGREMETEVPLPRVLAKERRLPSIEKDAPE